MSDEPQSPAALTLPPDAPGARVPAWVWLGLILLLGLGHRLYCIGGDSMWLDEFLAVENSTGRGHAHVKLPVDALLDPAPNLSDLNTGPGFFKIWTSLAAETHPPLYFMLLNLWRHMVGNSDVAVRSFSTFASLVGIVLLYHVMRLLHGWAPALWACLIMAVAGPQIQFSQETRQYTLLVTFTLAAALAIVRIEKLGPSIGRAIVLMLAILVMLLTHYLSFGPALAIGLYALIRLRGSSRKVAVAALAASLLIYLVSWGPYFYEQSKQFSEAHKWMLEDNPEGSTQRTLSRIASIPIRFFMEPMSDSRTIAHVGVVLFIIPLLLLPIRRDLLLWCLLMFLPIAQVAVSDVVRGAQAIGLDRYTFVSTAPAYALVAAMLAHSKGWMRHILPLAISVSCLAGLQRVYNHSAPDWREAGDLLRASVRPGDLIVMVRYDESDWQGGYVYLAISRYAPPKVPVAILSSNPRNEELNKLIDATPRVWVVVRGGTSPEQRQHPDRPITMSRFYPFCCNVLLYEKSTALK